MENSRFRQESHVAQQSRRDKLRVVQQSSTTCSSVQQQDHLPNNLEHLSVHSGENPDLVQVRNVRNGNNLLYEPTSTTTTSISTVFSSEMLNFATSSCNKVSSTHQRNAILDQEIGASSFTNNMSGPISSNFNASSPKASTSTDPHGCSSSNWRSIDSQQSYDWTVNYASGLSVGRESNQKPMFVGDVLSNNARVTNISTSTSTAEYLRPSFNGYQDFQSCLPNSNNEIPSNFHHHHHHHQLYNQNPLQVHDVVVSPAPALFFENVNSWMNNNTNTSELGLIARKNDHELKNININVSDPNTHQGLSLSLSSNPPSRANVIQFGSEDSKFVKSSNYFCPMPKPGIMIDRECGKSNNDSVVGGSSNFVIRNVGPLGPFTGYATILKSSRFLKPAQELLDEFCIVTSSKQLIIRTFEGSGRTYGATSNLASDDAVNVVDTEAGPKENNNSNNNNNSGISSSTFYSSNEVSGDVAVATSSCESYRPEYQQKKAKLLYLQEEVCRRYKQYQQQMQMVASSFESVAGLSAATPYVSLALKTVSRNFRCLKHFISDQLRHVTRALGEDLLAPNTVASSSKGDTSTSRMRYMDQSLQRHKSGGANVGFFEPQQHVWRPQRGLPERSVAILRAWLFEHFLHPYPTDTDKHMLASQTGLSRNQVSNWFINARVRVWKPMVEEIHMLETKGIAEMNRHCVNLDGKSADHGSTSQPNREQPSNILGANSMLGKQQQLECSSSAGSAEQVNAEQWNQEKRSRVDFQVPTGMDGSVMNFLPYQRSGIDIGGLGAVSLTLGLRHGVENAQHQQQQQQQQQQHTQLQQQHEDQLRRQFGGQMIHDFVG